MKNETDRRQLFSIDPARDWPWGSGENDNYQNECCSCKKLYRGHKRSVVCCKCQRESDGRWAAMTIEERVAHMRYVEEEMVKFCAENCNSSKIGIFHALNPSAPLRNPSNQD